MLDDEPADAAWNMAADAALLELAAQPTLRLYGFRPHAVSIGWFQPIAAFADVPADVPIVRRPTGGGAIHHGDELTFALVVDAARLPGDVASGYRLVHDAVLAALADLGVPAARNAGGPAQAARPTERWCFAEPGRDDLVTERGKLCGSAQRRVRNGRARVLHHGSLVLRRPALTAFAAAVEDRGPVTDAVRTGLRRRVAVRLAAALGLAPADGSWTDAERALTSELRRTFADPAHLRRR